MHPPAFQKSPGKSSGAFNWNKDLADRRCLCARRDFGCSWVMLALSHGATLAFSIPSKYAASQLVIWGQGTRKRQCRGTLCKIRMWYKPLRCIFTSHHVQHSVSEGFRTHCCVQGPPRDSLEALLGMDTLGRLSCWPPSPQNRT